MAHTIFGPYQGQVVQVMSGRLVERERKLILCSHSVSSLTYWRNKLYDYSDNYHIHLNPCQYATTKNKSRSNILVISHIYKPSKSNTMHKWLHYHYREHIRYALEYVQPKITYDQMVMYIIFTTRRTTQQKKSAMIQWKQLCVLMYHLQQHIHLAPHLHC